MSEKITLDMAGLKRKLEQDARAVGIPTGAAAELAEKIATKVMRWAKERKTITEGDLYRQLAKEAKNYNADLGYVYQNHGKII